MIASKRYAPWLLALTALFCFRVIAQPLSLVIGSSRFPVFGQWHSEVLPYGLLLPLQLLIIAVLARTTLSFWRGTVVPNRSLGRGLLVAGAAYAAVMIARLILGWTVMSGERWFAARLPTAFHFVLASFVILVGVFHARHG